MAELTLKGPFESRKASQSLRDQLVAHLQQHQTPIGSRFFSDSELTGLSGLSRKTVRKALDELHRDGWIVRQAGKGSFVGPRAASPLSARPTTSCGATLVRLAVLAYGMDHTTPDWYSQGVLHGIDEVAADNAISIELLGQNATDVKVLSQRLAQSRPDVLAVMPSTLHHALLVGEARRMGIPCVLTGTRLMSLGLPTVCEDSRQGAAAAVHHLVSKGHHRIGLLLRTDPAPWVFLRRTGYIEALTAAGIEANERLVYWLPMNPGDQQIEDSLMAYLEKNRPTALVLASGWSSRTLGLLVRSGRISIPRDLSVISFDQTYADFEVHLGLRPTTIELPLRAMGRRLAEMARNLAAKKTVPTQTLVPCELVEGKSVTTPMV